MRWAAWIVLLVLPGCDSAPPALDIPFPSLVGLDPAVIAHLQATETSLRRAVASSDPPDQLGNAFGEAAEAYHAYTFYDAADECYARATNLSPREARWRYSRGLVQILKGQPEAARISLVQARDLAPNSVPIRVAIADLAYEQNDVATARAEFEEALKLDADCAPALLGLGRLCLSDGDLDAAIGHLERALELQPGATRIHYPLGLAYRSKGDAAKAKVHLAQAGTVTASCADPWKESVDRRRAGDRLAQNHGTMLFRAGRYEDARREFEAAIRANPNNGLAYGHLASALLKLGQTGPAFAALQEAVRLAPNDATVNYNMGTFLARAGKDHDAITFYQRALEADDRFTPTRFNLASAYRRTRQWEQSAAEFGRVVREEPSNGVARFGRILALTQSHRYQEALDEGRLGLQVTRDVRIEQAIARILAAAPDDGVRDGVAALEIAKRLRAARGTLEHLEVEAMALAELGHYSEALTIQRRIIAAAREQARDELARSLEKNLRRYREQKPSRRPWERESL